MECDYFYLRVNNDDMVGDLINVGDVVMINRQSEVGPQDIAAIVNDFGIILRRVDRKGCKFILTASNPDLTQDECNDISIIGRVVKALVKIK
ncbi:hypothetical protein BVG16_16215 [Paenibacillus selenitireducens]|uniref:Peptidase S24/S26A/S26B/S26C domain-containing protein n=1 Tax=Paenibacillus selenitireducens TaxID=1324314 RepID=A0A1T2X9Y5_9BACL|nr:S24 family peptidase [Paenibacillus selenitireducens]OPA76714.1 hypothetical protein BVG16_16215 [Paenibacillus selenitireducens]